MFGSRCKSKCKNQVHMKFFNGRTPLHIAAENGFKSCVEFLINKGADKNAKNYWGF